MPTQSLCKMVGQVSSVRSLRSTSRLSYRFEIPLHFRHRSLYYCRSKSIQRAEDITTQENLEIRTGAGRTNSQTTNSPDIAAQLTTGTLSETQENKNYEECLACQ